MASRVAHLAQPGQILIEGSGGFVNQLHWGSSSHNAHIATLKVADDPSGQIYEEDVEIKFLGMFKIRVSLRPLHLWCQLF